MPEAEYLSASLALSVDGGELLNEFLYLPEGEHEVSALVNGKPATRKVIVGADSLEPLQASLSGRLARNVRPHGGFDHQEGGPASFIPKAFRYEEGRGVLLEVEWTEAGRQAVTGRNYSYFSPTFARNKKTGKPTGLLPHGEIGSLVNSPAFESIERLAASHQEPSDMEKIEELQAALVKEGLVTEEQSKDLSKIAETIKANHTAATETAVTDAVAEATKDAPEKSELEQTVERLKQENATLTEQLSARRAAEAKEAVEEAIKAGRIAPKDEKTIAYWEKAIAADPEAKAALKAIPESEALKAARTTTTDGDQKPKKGLARSIAAHSAEA